MIITIDGPALSGKSSTARLVAQKLNIHHVSSGLLYRALAYLLLQDDASTEALKEPDLHAILSYLNPHFLVYAWDEEGASHLTFHGEEITQKLQTPEIAQAASIVSTDHLVRQTVNAHLRYLAKQYDLIMDGRDCGSVVFPDADLKIFLTASLEVRAQRWLAQSGNKQTLQEIMEELTIRDKRDKERPIAPLIIPEGAVVIDSSDLSLQEVVDQIVGPLATIAHKIRNHSG